MIYDVTLPMNPPVCTVQHKGERVVYGKGGRAFVHHFVKKRQKAALDEYVKHLRNDIKVRRDRDGIGTYSMFTTGIRVKIDFMFPHPTYVAKRDRSKQLAKVTRPDVDNMAKGLLDCLTYVGLIQDDGLIYDLRLRKFTVEESKRGVHITISDEEETLNTEIETLKAEIAELKAKLKQETTQEKETRNGEV